MAPLQVELVTERGCTGTDCERCRETMRVLRDVMASGISRVLHVLNPLRPISPFSLEHRTCIEVPEACSGEGPPAIRVEGEMILQGPAWTEEDMRRALTKYLARDVTPSTRPMRPVGPA